MVCKAQAQDHFSAARGDWLHKLRPRRQLYNCNFTTVISANRQDALITKITLAAKHEKGDKRTLTWSRISETSLQLRAPTGESADFVKEQPAVALKVSTLAPAEKLIGFQDHDFQAQGRTHLAAITDHWQHLQKQSAGPMKDLLVSRPWEDAIAFYKDNMPWREGQYSFELNELNVTESRLRSPYVERFTLNLEKAHVDNFRSNLNLFEPTFRRGLGDKDVDGTQETWMWSHVPISPA